MRQSLSLTIFSLLIIFSTAISAANHQQQIDSIISAKEKPEGVVFEIVSGDSAALSWALPETKKAIEKLRQRFPELPIAVVTHGQEQFALQTANKNQFPKVHSLTESLVKDSGVNLHVCGTYADWHGVEAEEFAKHVNVAPAGPAQINDYIALGYTRVLIDKDLEAELVH